MMLVKGALHRMQHAVLCQAFDGGDLRSFHLGGEERTTFHGYAVHMHHTGAALTGVAADMGAGQAQLLAQEIDQKGAVLGLSRYLLAVHGECNHLHRTTISIKPRIITTAARPVIQITGLGASGRLRMPGAPALGGGGARACEKRAKNWSASCRAAASIRRWPIWASLPPTLARAL